MSLIWPDKPEDVVSDKPRLHALVIGVGRYRHLNGGPGPLAADPLGLSQVTTPPITAKKITDWLLEKYVSADCPLGSVELLLSPEEEIVRPDGQKKQTDPATFERIEPAFNQWEKRCSKHQDNKAFFYFCGHGLNKGTQFILPEDFGDPFWADPWRNNIDFDAMRVGMRSCKAQTQFFFIDACRETPFGLLDQINVTGQSLIKAKFSDSVACSAAYYATTEGKAAFGPEKDVTYFGQAVIKCLEGAGSSNVGGSWIVDTYSLSKALGDLMQHLGRKHKLALACNPVPSGMGKISEPAAPFVIASIRCKNEPMADPAAEIVMQRGQDTRTSAPGQEKPMIEEVAPGDWDFKVAFPGGQFAGPISKTYTLLPPVFEGISVP
jgi:hypothetical protein